jgi:hypothetical protein
MLEPKTFKVEEPAGEVTTRVLQDNIVETVYSGHVSKALLSMVADDAPRVLAAVPKLCWLVDLSAFSDLEMNLREPGQRIFRHFREGGGRGFAFVTNPKIAGSLIARTIIKGVSLTTRVSIHMTESREDALLYLRALGGKR